MTPEEEAMLRAGAAWLDLQAARLRMEAAAARATIASARLAAALRAGAEADELELLTFHPDAMELDMADAAWNPEAR